MPSVGTRPHLALAPAPHVLQRAEIFGWNSLPSTFSGAGTWLYRIYDASGSLLYIGISGHLGPRLNNHRLKKPWWPQVERIVVTLVGPEHIALSVERAAIRGEMPRYNRRSKPGAVVKAAA